MLRPEATLRMPQGEVALGRSPLLMGIVNVTPDSFSDGGLFADPARAIAHGEQLVAEGADWLDIGGESTRPGAEPVPESEELRRVLPVLEGLSAKGVPLSIDTYKPVVAREAVAAGASVINDVTGFRDPEMIRVAGDCRAVCVCMHMRGTPQTMAGLATYDDVVRDLVDYFEQQLRAMEAGGVDRGRVVLDPGIGFAKLTPHNLELMRRIDAFHGFGRPILLGASRKKIVGDLTGRPEYSRVHGTIAAVLCTFLRGVQIFRVHDVAAVRDALAVAGAIEGEG